MKALDTPPQLAAAWRQWYERHLTSSMSSRERWFLANAFLSGYAAAKWPDVDVAERLQQFMHDQLAIEALLDID